MHSFSKKVKGCIFLQGITGLIEQLLKIYLLYFVSVMTDSMSVGNFEGVKKLLPIVLLVSGIQVIFFFTAGYWRARCRKEYGFELQNRIYDSVLTAYMWKQDKSKKMQILNLYSTQIEELQEYAVQIAQIGIYAVTAVAASIFAIGISMKLFLLSCILVPLFSYLYQQLTKPLQKKSREIIQEKEELNSIIRESLMGFYIIKAYSLPKYFTKRFNGCAESLREREKEKDKIGSFLGRVRILLLYIPQLLVPLYGGYLGLKGEISLGNLIAVNMVMGYVISSVEKLLAVYKLRKEVEPVYEQVQSITDIKREEEKSGEANPKHNFSVEIRNLSFSYDDKHTVLKNMDLCMEKGEHLVLTGESGMGKSTLVKIICGLEMEFKGEVFVGGVPLNSQTQTQIRNAIAYVPQEPYIFQGTIADNICVGKKVTKEQLEAVARIAQVHSFISAFEQGYDTMVGEGGIQLSGGQKKRIAIARAVLQGSELLLMDEPMSALDSESAHKIIENIFSQYRDRAVLIISHKPSEYTKYAGIATLKGGRIADE